MSKKRLEVQRETIKYLENNQRKLIKPKIIKYRDDSHFFSPSNPLPPHTNFPSNNILISPLDTLDEVLKLKTQFPKERIGFLIHGNSTNKGGGYLRGTNGQEEAICRRTNLHQCFQKMDYPIDEFGCFYIKNISIFRENEENKWCFLKSISSADCIISAAYHSPPQSENKIIDGYDKKTERKIRTILKAFKTNGNKIIVLGAFGCGAFHNPVEHIALMFKKILKEQEFKNHFLHISFAILKSKGYKNYMKFQNVFM